MYCTDIAESAWFYHTLTSGVTRGLSHGRQSRAEGDPLITIGGPPAKTQKYLRNDSKSLDVVNVHTIKKKRKRSEKRKRNNLKNTKYQNVY